MTSATKLAMIAAFVANERQQLVLSPNRTSNVRISNPTTIKRIGRLGGSVLWALFRTVRVEVKTNAINPYDCQDADHYMYSVWHDSVLMAAFGGKHRGMVVLASRHRDGRMGASLVEGVGVKAVLGSSGPSGRAAVRQLLKLARTNDVVITPDGPRGPRRTMSRGLIFMASKTGNPIVPTAFSCDRAWEIKGSWTSLTVPKPFSRVRLHVGEAIRVPAKLDEQDLQEFTERVQSAMDSLELEANQGACRSQDPGHHDSLDRAA